MNIILNYILIRTIGAKGAAIATGISYVFFFSLRTIVSEHLIHVGFNKFKIFICTVVLIMNCIINTYIYSILVQYIVGGMSLLLVVLVYRNTLQQIVFFLKSNIMLRLKRR